MVTINVNELRWPTVLLHNYADFDCSYRFYYDETNNFRKFYVREKDFNYPFEANFILGGILYPEEKVNFDSLFSALNLQKNITDVKLKHLAWGSFLECLKSKKLIIYLQFLHEHPIFVHYSSVNLLFYAIADIVDSALMNSDIESQFGFHFSFKLKNDLYKLSKKEIDSFINLFHRYEYPNIKKDSIGIFIKDLTSLFEGYIDTEEFHFGLSSLKQILKEAEKKNFLPFITDEEDYILLKDFSSFYLHPLYLFKNSRHIFDEEDYIQELLDVYDFKDGKESIDIFEFRDSESTPEIQISDIFVGLMGKFSSYVNTTDIKTLENEISTLDEQQFENCKLLLSLIQKSSDYNKAFIHQIDSFKEFSKYEKIDALIFTKQ